MKIHASGTVLCRQRGCIGYLAHPFKKKAVWAGIVSLFLSVRGD
jgi:hypothetical protein